jgi:molecular chaperone DnaK
MKVFGLDFGTTNSVASVVVGTRCISLLDDNMPHPSIVCYQGDEVIVGKKAKAMLGAAGAGGVGNIVRSPKTRLGEKSVEVDGFSYSPKEVVRDVVKHVCADAKRQMPENLFATAVVTIPVDMNGARRRELREACRMAGVSVMQFVHEPLAALYGHLRNKENYAEETRRLNGEIVLVFDWGGGTLDLTLCRMLGGMLVQIKNDGCDSVGGDILDDMLVNYIEQAVLAKRGITHEVATQVGAKARLRASAEKAKVELSGKDTHPILVVDYFTNDAGDPDLEFRLTRSQLEECTKQKIEQGIRRIEKILESSRLPSSAVKLCLATGGMVNMPCIQSRLREIFGAQRVEISTRGNTIISEGAAWIAHDGARLMLSKNIELVVARKEYVSAIKAGTLMPSEGNTQKEKMDMYCVDPSDGMAKFQIVAPERPGKNVQTTDERKALGTVTVRVDEEKWPLQERLCVDFSIDDNLILHVDAWSSLARDRERLEIHELEFGLAAPLEMGDIDSKEFQEKSINFSSLKHEKGAIILRANVSHKNKDESNIPGEVARILFGPEYFDRNSNPKFSELQNEEKLLYQTCDYCQQERCICTTLLRAGWNPPK